MRNTRLGLTPNPRMGGGTLDDDEIGDGEVIKRIACGGSGYGNTVDFVPEAVFGLSTVSGVVRGLRRILGMRAGRSGRRGSLDNSRVCRISIRRLEKGRDVKKDDDRRIAWEDEG